MSSSNWSNAAGGARTAGARQTVAGYFADSDDANRAIRELVDEGFALNDIGAAFHSGSAESRRGPHSSSTATSASAPTTRSQRGGQGEGNFPLQFQGNQDLSPAGATSDTEAVSPWGLFTGGGTPFAGASRPGPITGSEIPPDLPRDLPSDLAPESRNRASSHDTYSNSAFENSFIKMGIPIDRARGLSRDLRNGGAVVTIKVGAKSAAAESVIERNHGTICYESAPGQVEEGMESGGRVDVFGEIHRVYPGYIPGEDVRQRKAS